MAMRFEHEFTVPVPVERAWTTLLDVERVAPCLPGASVDAVQGDEFSGRMKVKVGPITVVYRGKAVFEEIDKDGRTVTMKASGKETKGAGTANATVHARLLPRGETTLVTVETSFNVTGRPAQFGRGVMAEVGAKLIDRFAENLSALLASGEEAVDGGASAAATAEATAEPSPPSPVSSVTAGAPTDRPAEPSASAASPLSPERAAGGEGARPSVPPARVEERARVPETTEEEALDLLEVAGAPVLKRLAPVAAVLAALALIAWFLRRSRRTG